MTLSIKCEWIFCVGSISPSFLSWYRLPANKKTPSKEHTRSLRIGPNQTTNRSVKFVRTNLCPQIDYSYYLVYNKITKKTLVG